MTLKPTQQEYGLEIAGKFPGADDAWIAGESHPPSLLPGYYTIKASISHGSAKATIIERRVANPGADATLHGGQL